MEEASEHKTVSQHVLSTPRPVTHLFLAYAEAYVLLAYFPQYTQTRSLRDLIMIFFAMHTVSQFVWNSVLYPFFFSPLRRIPRPKDWVTGDTVIFQDPRGTDCLRWIKETPNEGLIRARTIDGGEYLLVTSPKVYSEVLVHNSYTFVKPRGARNFLSRIIGWGVIIAEGDMHKAQRRSLTPAFQLKNIRELYPLMWGKSVLLADMIKKEIIAEPSSADAGGKEGIVTGNVEIGTWASRFTLDIIGPAAMGRDFQSLQSNKDIIARNYLGLLKPNLARLLNFAFALFTPTWVSENVPSPTKAYIKRTISEVRAVCLDIIREKKEALEAGKEGNQHKDILTHMLAGKDIPDEVCVDQMLTFMIGGHETTANAIAWACYEFSKHDHYQKALREELRGVISDPSQAPAPTDLESLPLLNAFCNEVLRLHPTVPMTVRENSKDVTLADHSIPKGTWFIVCPWATNRDPSLWGDDADDFRPERWIDTVSDDKGIGGAKQRLNSHGGSNTNYAQMTFLHGPRSCIGQGFSKAELRCGIAALVGNFDIRLQRPDEKIRSIGAVTPKPKNGMNLKLGILKGWCVEP